MKIEILLFFITGVLFFTSLFIGHIFVFNLKSLRVKSFYSIFLSLCLFIYLVSVILLLTSGVFLGEFFFLPYIIFALAPFVIGKFVTFKKLAFYTTLEILIVFVGCISSFLIINC